MTTKYICTHCTGTTGEEHTFRLSKQPKACPYSGCSERHVETIEAYLRQQLQDAEWEAEHYEEKWKDAKS